MVQLNTRPGLSHSMSSALDTAETPSPPHILHSVRSAMGMRSFRYCRTEAVPWARIAGRGCLKRLPSRLRDLPVKAEELSKAACCIGKIIHNLQLLNKHRVREGRGDATESHIHQYAEYVCTCSNMTEKAISLNKKHGRSPGSAESAGDRPTYPPELGDVAQFGRHVSDAVVAQVESGQPGELTERLHVDLCDLVVAGQDDLQRRHRVEHRWNGRQPAATV